MRNFIQIAVLVAISTTACAGQETHWRKLPPPPGRSGGIRSLALDGSTPWAMTDAIVFWDGRSWQKPTGQPLRGGIFAAVFGGGQDRPLYCTQPTDNDQYFALYLLSESEAHLAGKLKYKGPAWSPRIYVTKTGAVFNFTDQGVQYIFGREMAQQFLPANPTWFFERGTSTYFCYAKEKKIIEFKRGNIVGSTKLDMDIPKSALGVKAFLWSKNRVLVTQANPANIQCFDLTTGKTCDIQTIRDELGKTSFQDGFTTRDQSVWLLERPFKSKDYRLVQITAEGVVQEPAGLEMIDMHDYAMRGRPRRVMESKDGSLWFGLVDSIVHYANGSARQFKTATGFDLSGCRIIEDRVGTVYASNGSVYQFDASGSVDAELMVPRIPIVSKELLWSFPITDRHRFEAARLDGATIYVSASRLPLIAINKDSGEQVFRKQIHQRANRASGPFHTPWFIRSRGNELEFATAQGIVRLDAKSGDIKHRLDLPHDPRIAPIKTANGYLVVPEYRGRELKLIDPAGTTIWTHELPGYLQGHPAVSETQTILQTRGSSYGGQTSLGVDIRSGQRIWTDQTDAYGKGATFAGQSIILEANHWLSPKRTDGWIIARSQDGQRLWEHREAEQPPRRPIIDADNNRAYCVFSIGKVICFNITDGTPIWQRTFTETLSKFGGFSSYFPGWSPHSLRDDRLLVVDKNLVLHVLDAVTGKFMVSVALRGNPSPRPYPNPELIAAPWITDKSIIAAFKHEIIAMPLPKKLKVKSNPVTD